MLRILHGTSYDFIKYWRHAAIITIAFIVVGLTFLAVHGAHYSIEFTGGTTLQVQFAQAPNPDAIRSTVDGAGFAGSTIQQFGSPTEFTISAQPKSGNAALGSADSTAKQIEAALHAQFGDTSHVRVVQSQYIGPQVGAELRRNAMIAVAISFLVTLIYLAIRFEWRFGVAAVVATAHDIFTTLAFLAMLRLEISLTVVAAILTVIGYSLNDTIIIFDRVREDLRKQRKEPLRDTHEPRHQRDAAPLGADPRHDADRHARAALLRRRGHPAVRLAHGVRHLHGNVQLHLRGRRVAALDRGQVAPRGRRTGRGRAAAAALRPAQRPLTSPRTAARCAAVLPSMADFIDSHAHLADPAFDDDRAAVIERARLTGARAIVCIGESLAAADRARAAGRAHPDSSGSPPASIRTTPRTSIPCATRECIGERIRQGAVAIGECGLDYHYDHSPRPEQRRAFSAQLALARDVGRPVVVHTREAEADTRAMVEEAGAGGVRGVLHCFTGSHQLAETALAVGWYVSFSGVVTFKKWNDDALLRLVPDDRLLVESDAPYLAPVPHRGTRNEPAWVTLTLARVAHARGTDAAALGAVVTRNAARLFGLAIPGLA